MNYLMKKQEYKNFIPNNLASLVWAGDSYLENIHAWAISVNRLNCENVWIFDKQSDLAESYYAKNIKVLESLLITGASRLASILNEIL